MFTVLYLVLIVFGLFLLIKSTEVFIKRSVLVFFRINISLFVIGALVVGFGTSLPELGIAVVAAMNNNLILGLSSAVGSNIANIALIMGVSMILFSRAIYRLDRSHIPEVFFLIAISVLLLVYEYHGLTRFAGIVFLSIFSFYILYMLVFDDHTKHIKENTDQDSTR